MTWTNRLRLFLGSIAVLAIAAACTLVFNQRQLEATSTSATIAAQVYPVGTEYAGTVTRTFVKQGQTVAIGDPLVSVQSAQLIADVKQKSVPTSSLGYTVTKAGVMTFKATVAGTIDTLSAFNGKFVQAGTSLVSIDRKGSLFVTARYLLDATDYGRLTKAAPVDIVLPNQSSISGHVRSIAVVTTSTGQAQAEVLVDSSKLIQGADNGIVAPGTPLTARVHLRADGPFAGLQDQASALLQHIGL